LRKISTTFEVYSFSSSGRTRRETSESTLESHVEVVVVPEETRLRGRAGWLAVEAAHEGTGLLGAIQSASASTPIDLDGRASPVHDVLAAGAVAGDQEQEERDHAHEPQDNPPRRVYRSLRRRRAAATQIPCAPQVSFR